MTADTASRDCPATDVYSLRDATFLATYALPPREAVRNAYAQFALHDFNTWDYAKYDHLVEQGGCHVFCGDFAARIPAGN